MGQAAPQSFFTAADYLAWEAAQLDRHEYIDGEVFAMAGAEDRHVRRSPRANPSARSCEVFVPPRG